LRGPKLRLTKTSWLPPSLEVHPCRLSRSPYAFPAGYPVRLARLFASIRQQRDSLFRRRMPDLGPSHEDFRHLANSRELRPHASSLELKTNPPGSPDRGRARCTPSLREALAERGSE